MQRTLLFLLVAASYLLFAGGVPWSIGPLLWIAALAAIAAPRRTFAFPRELRSLDLSLAAVLCCLISQAIPLPAGVVAALSPAAGGVRAALQFATVTAPDWTTLSIDPQSTVWSAATMGLSILAFWVARAVFSAGGNTRSFCRLLALFGAVAAVLAIVQKATTPRLLLFVLEPDARSASPFGAFTNRNHLAAWLLLIIGPVSGYLIARLRTHPAYRARSAREALKRFLGSGIVLTAVAIAIMLLVLLTTLSRSAVIGVGAAALCGSWLGRHRMNLERSSLPTILGMLGGVLLASMTVVDIDGWATRLQQTLQSDPMAIGRLTIWRESVPIVQDFWLTGTGAGTYSEAMTQYQRSRVWMGSMQQWTHFNNAHSAYVQLASEGGLLLTVPVLAALGLLQALGRRAVRADKGEMFWVRVGAAAGLFGLAVQCLWEVPLVMPANAVLCGVLAGLLLFRRDGSRSSPSPDDLLTPERG